MVTPATLGLPRDNFEAWEITKEEFETFRL
jgi:hypothetical protein